MKNLYVILLVIALQSCAKLSTSSSSAPSQNIVDTLVYVDSLNFRDNRYYSSRDTAAVYRAIQDYFIPKGYYPEEKMTLDTLLTHDIEPEPQCVGFDTLYPLNLNADNVEDYLVTYFKMPCGASGNQWRPHMAIVTSINGNYKLISEDLLPDYWYHIDSLATNRDKILIYGKIFDRATLEFAKKYRATIIKN